MQRKALIIKLQVKPKKENTITNNKNINSYNIKEYRSDPNKITPFFQDKDNYKHEITNWDNAKDEILNILVTKYTIKKSVIIPKPIKRAKSTYYNEITNINYKLFGLIKTRNKIIDNRHRDNFNIWENIKR